MTETPEEIAVRAYRNAYQKAYRDHTAKGGETVAKPFPCSICGAKDSRDENHQQGCPELAPVPKDALIRLARRVEAGWIAVSARRAAAQRKR